MAGPENIIEEVTPHVKKLIILHHPDWNPDDVEQLTPRATRAIVELVIDVLNLPKDPDQSEPLYQQALNRFNSRFSPTLEAEQ